MNSSRTFWMVFMLLCAVGAHLAYILFVPTGQMRAHLEHIADEAGSNRLIVAKTDNAAGVLATYSGELAYAMCVFDLSNGPLRVSAQIPDQFWSIELYDLRGGTLYTLDDRQIKRKQLTFIVRAETPDTDTLVDVSSDQPTEKSAISVLAGAEAGVVVLRSAAASELEKYRALAAFRNSSCGAIAG